MRPAGVRASGTVSRTSIVVLVAVAAAVAGFAITATANRIGDEEAAPLESRPAAPQRADLAWRESFGPGGERLVFVVEWLEVVPGGWRARLALENNTSVAYEVGDPRATLDRAFGLMLFSSGDIEDLEQRNASNTLPAIRSATRYRPALPAILEPGAAWEGTIEASGALAAGSWVRVVFGALVAVAKPPEGLPERVVWITDHAHQLKR
jgi:hypothetical protein